MRFRNLSELKDSKIFFDKEPPKFITYFVCLLLILLILFIYLATILPKNYIVKGQGNIQSSDKIYVSSSVNGRISEIVKNEGEIVKKGDVILKLASGPENINSNETQKQVEGISSNIDAIELYTKSLNDDVNYLKNEGMEQAYYGKMKYYLEERSKNIKAEQTAKNELKQIQSEKNNTLNQIKELENKSDKITEEIKAEKEKVKSQDKEIDQKQKEVESYPQQTRQTYNQLLGEVGVEKNQLENKKIEIQGQKNVAKNNESFFDIIATNDGKLSYTTPITTGVFVQNGESIASIFGSDNSKLIAKTYIPAIERAKIDIGDNVVINVDGLNETKYGSIKGKISKISVEPIVPKSTKEQQPIYELIIDLESTELKDFNIYNGLSVISNVIYDSETYFEYILDQLRLK